MLKRIVLFGLFMCLSTNVFAQSETYIKQKTRYRLGLILPSLSLETPLKKDMSLKLNVIGWFSKEGHAEPYIQVTPTVLVEPRFYTNMDKRRKKQKNTDYFCGSYVGIPVSTTILKDQTVNIFGLLYGRQGKIGSNALLYYDTGIGFGFLSGSKSYDMVAAPLIYLDFGFRLR